MLSGLYAKSSSASFSALSERLAYVHKKCHVHVSVNIATYVNTPDMENQQLIAAFASKLREILTSVDWLQGWHVRQVNAPKDLGYDLLATLPLTGREKAALCVECKQDVRPSMFHNLATRVFALPAQATVALPVLALPNVSNRMAELCAEHKWGWLDLAGNYRIDVPGYLHIQHTGNPPVREGVRPSANLSTPEVGRVLRALLALDNLGKRWTQRELQLSSEPLVSLGLVNKIVRRLFDDAYLEGLPDRGFRVREYSRLLFAWRDAYRFDRHERRDYFTLIRGKALQNALSQFEAKSHVAVAYAAFSAAEFQAPHVRQPRTWLFVGAREIPLFQRLLEAKEVDSGENIVVLIPNDDGVFYKLDRTSAGQPNMACTNLVQTYIDLSHCGGRGEEAAEALFEQRLNSDWKRMQAK